MPATRAPRAAAADRRRRQTPPPRRATAAELRRQARAARRARRFALLALVLVVLIVTLALMAFGSGTPQATEPVRLASGSRLLPAGPPRPQVIALQGPLRIQLPIAQSEVTAVGYHAASDGALALQPFGKRANEGVVARLFHKVFGGGGGGLRWYQLPGGQGARTAALDVGAPPGTDVYAPVDGTIVGLTDYVLDGRVYGKRIDVQPAGSPSVVVSLTHLRPDPALTVGSSVAAANSKIGTIVDVSKAERQALAAHTQDAGNHVTIEVRQAASLPIS
jgi:murein DD-endopeptidase MepM/ murein hydrolase activator NlpD